MSMLRVTVTDHIGERARAVEIPGDYTVETLLQVLPGRLGYRLEDSNAEPISYRLYRDGMVLPLDQTLQQLAVQDRDTLSLSSEPVAGCV